MSLWKLISIALILLSFGCSGPELQYYHWTSSAELSDTEREALNQSGTQTVYMHFFDVDRVHAAHRRSDGVYPTYVLDSLDPGFLDYEIVPVVFITQSVFSPQNPKPQYGEQEPLADRLTGLIQQMSKELMGRPVTRIQVDCDWTESSREPYFELLEGLMTHFEVEVTIRLHQIKYAERTGVPPVTRGTLMLYNMGDLRDMSRNSIIDPKITADYIDARTEYPLVLDVALPLFSQTIIKNRQAEYRISNHHEPALIAADLTHFESISETHYQVLQDTLYHGFQLSPGYELKLESSPAEVVIESYKLLSRSQLNLEQIILYKLADEDLKTNTHLRIRQAL